MGTSSNFGKTLARLIAFRELNTSSMAEVAGLRTVELSALLDGAVPNLAQLGQLAPALGLHLPDLLVVAGLTVPNDLNPLDPDAGRYVPRLVKSALSLSIDRQVRLRKFVNDLPREQRLRDWPPPRKHEQYPSGGGGILLRMLRNRNLDWAGSQAVLYCVAHVGPLSASTVGGIGHGRIELTFDLLVGFSTILGVPVEQLAILASIEFPHVSQSDSSVSDVAGLIWDLRRLSWIQVDHVRKLVEAGADFGVE